MSSPPDQMLEVDRAPKTYSFEVDPEAANNSHSMVIGLVGTGRRVLEVGCGGGHVAHHLRERGNEVVGIDVDPAAVAAARRVLDEVHCCDLDVVDASVLVQGPFDVIILADVLEHLRQPGRVLGDLLSLLAADGRVLLSIPNVAHVDVRLMLLLGEWRYQPLGLLDDTHLRWFSRRAIAELLRGAGLEPLSVQRTVADAFCSGVAVERARVPADLVAAVLADQEATTYQFVIEAGRSGGDWTLLEPEVVEPLVLPDAVAARAEADVLRGDLDEMRRTVDLLQADLAGVRHELDQARAAEAAWHNTRLVRYSAPCRRVWARIIRR